LARISLNWTIGAPTRGTFFHRKHFKHEIIKLDSACNDDIWTMNTQSSSQWDGFRHYGYQKEGKFYNGVTMDQIHKDNGAGEKSEVNGIHGEDTLHPRRGGKASMG
jgi:hypothetical protein